MVVMSLTPMAAQETGIFIDMVLESGETESLMLRNDASYVGARFIGPQRLFKINGKEFDMSQVKEIRFTRREVTDGIRSVTPDASAGNSKNAVYDLQGRRVKSPLLTSPRGGTGNGLKPGLYIVNGKKVVVK